MHSQIEISFVLKVTYNITLQNISCRCYKGDINLPIPHHDVGYDEKREYSRYRDGDVK